MKSLEKLRKTLRKFGASQFVYREDFDADGGNLIFVEFRYDRYPVVRRISVDSIAMLYLEKNPWSTKRRCTETEYIDRVLEKSRTEAMQMLVEHVITLAGIVDAGGATFEETFLGYFKLKDGRTVAQHLLPALDEMVDTGQIPLLKGLGRKKNVR